jgi:hypothetical protein
MGALKQVIYTDTQTVCPLMENFTPFLYKHLTIIGPGGETSMSCPASADCCLISGGTVR